MKIAIIYTGAVRTIEKTIDHFVNNILLNDDTHVFAVIQSTYEIYYAKLLREKFKSHLKSIKHFRIRDPDWIDLQKILIDQFTNPCTKYQKDYLLSSGSMVEYYQLHLAYIALYEYEKQHNFKYDYIMRTRTDVVYTQKLTFEWLNWNVEDIRKIFPRDETNKDNAKYVCNVMNGLVMPSRTIIDIVTCYNKTNNDLLFNDLIQNYTDDKLINYIRNGRYIIIGRGNIVYIIKRDYFDRIQSLGYSYGLIHSEETYWWNAETQLSIILFENNITIFDSCTHIEMLSLYDYDTNNYYLEDACTLKDLDDLLFFIQRI